MPAGVTTFTESMRDTISSIKDMDIYGCITGSSLLDTDFDLWDEKPDIDIFVWSLFELASTVQMLISNGYQFGTGTELSKRQEAQKFAWLRKGQRNKKYKLDTIKVCKPAGNEFIVVNVTNKMYQTSMIDVITVFDMSIVMKGYDLHTKEEIDFTTKWGPANVAHPNKLREHDTSAYTVMYWTRQFKRVIKYWQRGYDTRPMAKFYIDMIDEYIETGDLWPNGAAKEMYEDNVVLFTETKRRILEWLSDKED